MLQLRSSFSILAAGGVVYAAAFPRKVKEIVKSLGKFQPILGGSGHRRRETKSFSCLREAEPNRSCRVCAVPKATRQTANFRESWDPFLGHDFRLSRLVSARGLHRRPGHWRQMSNPTRGCRPSRFQSSEETFMRKVHHHSVAGVVLLRRIALTGCTDESGTKRDQGHDPRRARRRRERRTRSTRVARIPARRRRTRRIREAG